jgi:hypothetical protein
MVWWQESRNTMLAVRGKHFDTAPTIPTVNIKVTDIFSSYFMVEV